MNALLERFDLEAFGSRLQTRSRILLACVAFDPEDDSVVGGVFDLVTLGTGETLTSEDEGIRTGRMDIC